VKDKNTCVFCGTRLNSAVNESASKLRGHFYGKCKEKPCLKPAFESDRDKVVGYLEVVRSHNAAIKKRERSETLPEPPTLSFTYPPAKRPYPFEASVPDQVAKRARYETTSLAPVDVPAVPGEAALSTWGMDQQQQQLSLRTDDLYRSNST